MTLLSGIIEDTTSDVAKAAASDAAKAAASDAAKVAASDAAKVAATDAAKVAATDAAKVAATDAAKVAATDAAKQAVEDAAKESGKYSAKDIAAATAAAAALGIGAYTYLSAKDAADLSNSTPRVITLIELKDSTTNMLTITYTPSIAILLTDGLVLSGTKTTPSIDGPASVVTVIAPTQIQIDPGKSIPTLAPGGSIAVTTTVANQAASMIGQAATILTGNIFGPGGKFSQLSALVKGIIYFSILMFLFLFIYLIASSGSDKIKKASN